MTKLKKKPVQHTNETLVKFQYRAVKATATGDAFIATEIKQNKKIAINC